MTEPRVVTLGCRLNTLESEVIRGEAAAAGLKDIAIVNTCAVTGEAVRQARQTIRRLYREDPARPIIVTGCAAQLAPAEFAAMPEVARVLGNKEKLDRRALAEPAPLLVGDIFEAGETAPHLLDGFDGRTRTFVQIQQGCDHRCTYCIIPYARGANRSIAADRIVEQVRRLVGNGYREVVLTGVDICSWGRDHPGGGTLGGLVQVILREIPDLPRLRLSSLDPAAIDDSLLAALECDARLMPHWHLSLQAGSDLILKRMRRRHRAADVIALAERARRARPGMVFGADLIAGFPTETDEQFRDTEALIDAAGITLLHVFPFSPRDGTPAARMPQVPPAVRKQRAAALRRQGDRRRDIWFESRIGSRTAVLVEQSGKGRCPAYAPVRLAGDAPVGTIIDVLLTGMDGDTLIAEVLP